MDRDSKIQARKMFHRVFTTEDGKCVLGNILTNLGCFETDPSLINPHYIAFANRLLHDIGINHRENLENIMGKLIETANEKDIEQES